MTSMRGHQCSLRYGYDTLQWPRCHPATHEKPTVCPQTALVFVLYYGILFCSVLADNSIQRIEYRDIAFCAVQIINYYKLLFTLSSV